MFSQTSSGGTPSQPTSWLSDVPYSSASVDDRPDEYPLSLDDDYGLVGFDPGIEENIP